MWSSMDVISAFKSALTIKKINVLVGVVIILFNVRGGM